MREMERDMDKKCQDQLDRIAVEAFPAVSEAIAMAVLEEGLIITDSDSLKYTAAYTGDFWTQELQAQSKAA